MPGSNHSGQYHNRYHNPVAAPGALRLHALPRFGLEALYGEGRDVPENHGVPGSSPGSATPSYFLVISRKTLSSPLALFTAALTERGIHHKCYHNGHSLEALREVVVEAHGRLTMHGGGDVGV